MLSCWDLGIVLAAMGREGFEEEFGNEHMIRTSDNSLFNYIKKTTGTLDSVLVHEKQYPGNNPA